MRSGDVIVAGISIIAASLLIGFDKTEGGLAILTMGTSVWAYGRGRRSGKDQ